MVKHLVWITILCAGLAIPAAAQTRGTQDGQAAGRQGRGAALAQRLKQGIRQGQLTRGELARLRLELQRVRSQARALRSAGTPATPDQRHALRQELGKLNRMIFVMRHNRIRKI